MTLLQGPTRTVPGLRQITAPTLLNGQLGSGGMPVARSGHPWSARAPAARRRRTQHAHKDHAVF
eukprot:1374851-Alexandrium_andersonii.AAC.1